MTPDEAARLAGRPDGRLDGPPSALGRNGPDRKTDLREAARMAAFWEHHRDCRPLGQEACRCGLTRFQALVRRFQAK